MVSSVESCGEKKDRRTKPSCERRLQTKRVTYPQGKHTTYIVVESGIAFSSSRESGDDRDHHRQDEQRRRPPQQRRSSFGSCRLSLLPEVFFPDGPHPFELGVGLQDGFAQGLAVELMVSLVGLEFRLLDPEDPRPLLPVVGQGFLLPNPETFLQNDPVRSEFVQLVQGLVVDFFADPVRFFELSETDKTDEKTKVIMSDTRVGT